jgi:hypothetical protein
MRCLILFLIISCHYLLDAKRNDGSGPNQSKQASGSSHSLVYQIQTSITVVLTYSPVSSIMNGISTVMTVVELFGHRKFRTTDISVVIRSSLMH